MSRFLRLLSAFKRPFLWLVFVGCCANVLAVFVVVFELGGDVSRGKVINGHFYVQQHLGTFVEVSESTYKFAQWQLFSIFVTGLLAKAIWQHLRPKA